MNSPTQLLSASPHEPGTGSACPSPVILLTPSAHGVLLDGLTVPKQDLLRCQRSVLALAAGLGLRAIVSSVQGQADGADPELLCGAFAKPEILPRPSPDALQCAELFTVIDRSPNRVLVLAGVLIEVEIYLTALTAIKRGFEVHVLIDACAGANARAETAALQTMAAQGVRLSNVAALMAQLLRDVTTHHAMHVAQMVRIERHGVARLAGPTALLHPPATH